MENQDLFNQYAPSPDEWFGRYGAKVAIALCTADALYAIGNKKRGAEVLTTALISERFGHPHVDVAGTLQVLDHFLWFVMVAKGENAATDKYCISVSLSDDPDLLVQSSDLDGTYTALVAAYMGAFAHNDREGRATLIATASIEEVTATIRFVYFMKNSLFSPPSSE